jgi:hypothetical protein
MCMSSGPKGPDQSLIRQQQEAMRKQEALLTKQLNEARAASEAMRASQKVSQERADKAIADAETRRKEQEENLKVKQAKTEAAMAKGIANITDKTRGRAGLKINKQMPSVGISNPMESLLNLPV